MRGSRPKVAPLGLSHCLPASVVRTDAAERIASIGLDLSKGGHPLVSPSVFLDTGFPHQRAGIEVRGIIAILS